MTSELICTIVFGIAATAIGLVTIWQNFQIVNIKLESEIITLPAKLTELTNLGHSSTPRPCSWMVSIQEVTPYGSKDLENEFFDTSGSVIAISWSTSSSV